jgi:hypothetical protein
MLSLSFSFRRRSSSAACARISASNASRCRRAAERTAWRKGERAGLVAVSVMSLTTDMLAVYFGLATKISKARQNAI